MLHPVAATLRAQPATRINLRVEHYRNVQAVLPFAIKEATAAPNSSLENSECGRPSAGPPVALARRNRRPVALASDRTPIPKPRAAP